MSAGSTSLDCLHTSAPSPDARPWHVALPLHAPRGTSQPVDDAVPIMCPATALPATICKDRREGLVGLLAECLRSCALGSSLQLGPC